jgi:hypothetical protein
MGQGPRAAPALPRQLTRLFMFPRLILRSLDSDRRFILFSSRSRAHQTTKRRPSASPSRRTKSRGVRGRVSREAEVTFRPRFCRTNPIHSKRRIRATPADGKLGGRGDTVRSIRAALDAHGVEFIDENGGGPGVSVSGSTRSQESRRLKTILVTGCSGIVGSHACKALSRAGYLPVTFDNIERGYGR